MLKSVLIIAGEASGDLHGAALIKELKKLDSEINFFGVGGNKMKDSGLELIYHSDRMSFLGFVEVVKHLPFIKRVQNQLLEEVKIRQTKFAILIDYPGFNISIAKKLKQLGVEIYYYISPQVWAWGKGRVKKIKKLVRKMFVVFPFEEKFYKEKDVDAEFVGHPLVRELNEYNFLSKEELRDKLSLASDKEILLLLPGSRKHEVEDIFPQIYSAAKKISEKFNLQIVVACASSVDESLLREVVPGNDYKIVAGFTYDLMKHSKFGIIKSGTSTLEAGLLNLPMIIVYKANTLTYLIGKTLVELQNIGIVNILLGKTLLPELIQNDVITEKIFSEANNILSDSGKYISIKNELKKLWDLLGNQNAAQNAAKKIYQLINEKS
ncbi:Lipid A disaccharide synthetase [Ignavibacterium album JCM 16511]|uniref:Lipid-A-disaccharide synthase n=1 Tax=Ignavibacterium album (strain DSM 19864 / JCM 16511 / NBRC 101810 / Mat9-16) TaxID=945713 RepID=I0AGE9_IGNAJ|nr:lipid-A-disaccharide synthase [Ignavibacterium album]AFH48056.1 Lipid A disaccharide synthetase [Ignavibacterium album JCM 16511]